MNQVIKLISSLPWWIWVLFVVVIVAIRDVLQPHKTPVLFSGMQTLKDCSYLAGGFSKQ